MSVRKKFETPKVEDVDVEALIEKGAKVKEDRIEEDKLWKSLNLRIPVDMLEDIDSVVKDRVGMPRTAWILEAIQEKLKRLNE